MFSSLFSVQDLTVTVMSERSTREIELAEDPDELHRVNKQSFIDEQEWHLYKVTMKATDTKAILRICNKFLYSCPMPQK